MKLSERKALVFAALGASAAIGAYILKMYVLENHKWSSDPADWSYFGSYIGGTVGVCFALATVWMLAETLRLQREELKATREELMLTRVEAKKSNQALQDQAKASRESIKQDFIRGCISALNETTDNIMSTRRIIANKEKSLEDVLIQEYDKAFDSDIIKLEYQLGTIAIFLRDHVKSSSDRDLVFPLLSRHSHIFFLVLAHNKLRHIDSNLVQLLINELTALNREVIGIKD